MIVIYKKMETKRVAEDVASQALQALEEAIERIEARGECTAFERARWQTLRSALVDRYAERL